MRRCARLVLTLALGVAATGCALAIRVAPTAATTFASEACARRTFVPIVKMMATPAFWIATTGRAGFANFPGTTPHERHPRWCGRVANKAMIVENGKREKREINEDSEIRVGATSRVVRAPGE